MERKILRKRNVIIVSVIILLLLSSFPLSRGLYQGTPGDIYYFDILKASVDLKLGGNDYSGNRFTVSGNPLVPPQTASCEIMDFPTSMLLYSLVVGSYAQNIHCLWYSEDEYDFYYMILNPLANCEDYLSNPALVSDGFDLFFYPFADTTDTYDTLSEFIAQTHSSLTPYLTQENPPIFEVSGGKSGDIFTFESYFEGLIEDVHPPAYSLRFKTQLKCYYEYDDGVLYGIHYKVSLRGEYDGQSATITCEFLAERINYDLPTFTLGGFDIYEDWWIIAAAGGGGLLLIIIVIIIAVSVSRKKKPKKKKKKSTSGKKKKR